MIVVETIYRCTLCGFTTNTPIGFCPACRVEQHDKLYPSLIVIPIQQQIISGDTNE